jgi:hypothetical protein
MQTREVEVETAESIQSTSSTLEREAGRGVIWKLVGPLRDVEAPATLGVEGDIITHVIIMKKSRGNMKVEEVIMRAEEVMG